MSTALDIIKGALRRVNSYQPGETISPWDAQDCLESLNDLFDSWSTDKLYCFASNETILSWIVGQNQYRIGNPSCTALGEPNFTGVVTGGSSIISAVTNIPSDLIAGTSYNQVGAGSTLTDQQNLFPANTYVMSIGANTIVMSAPATGNSQGADEITYTIPGDFPIPRPLRITGGYTRINALDFTLDIAATQDE